MIETVLHTFSFLLGAYFKHTLEFFSILIQVQTLAFFYKTKSLDVYRQVQFNENSMILQHFSVLAWLPKRPKKTEIQYHQKPLHAGLGI